MNKFKFKSLLAVVLTVLMVFSIVPVTVSAEEAAATISFADKANRTEYSTDIQVWEQNGITVTNNKAASTSNVGDYANPGRFYKSSETTIAFPGMTKIVVDCTDLETKYITPWSNSFTDGNATAVVEGTTVTITFANAVDSFTWTAMSAQARAKSISVYTAPKAPVVTSANIGFADKANRTEYSTDIQVWEQNGITVTNKKAASTSNVGDYANPGRFYKSSETTIAFPGMTKIVVDCTDLETKYITPWSNSFTDSNATAVVEGTTVTITFANAVDSFTWTSMSAQARANQMTVYTGDAEGGSTPDTPVVPATLAEQIAAAKALANKAYLPYESTITGTITDAPQASSYTEGQYKFTVSDGTNTLLCYYVPVTGGTPEKGDTVTVTGKLTAFDGSAQFDSTAAATITKKAEAEGGEDPDPTVTFPIKDGDSFAISYPAGGTVIGNTASGKKLAAVEAPAVDGKVTRVDGMAEFTADFIDATTFYLLVDGKYLTSGATGNSLSLEAAASDYAVWTLEEATNGWYIKNVNAAYSGKAQYVEFYSGFTTYGLNTSKADIYTFNFCAIVEPPPFKDGDSFVIYYPAGSTVIGSTASGKKLAAVEATIVDGKVTFAEGMAVFTADFIDATTFYLLVDGKYLTSGATGNSLSLEAAASDYAVWTLEEAANGYYVKNVNAAYSGKAQYIEFYSGFTTYGLNTSKADIYTFNFYSVEVPEVPGECTHTNTETVGAKEATETEEGYTGDTVCKDCGATVANGEKIPVKTPESSETPDLSVITAPKAGVAYKFGMVQGNVGKTFYLKGGMSGYYMATTDNVADAIDVYLEETEGGYYLYTMVDGVKTYINMVVSGTHVNGAYEATATTVYKWNAEKNTIVAEIDGADYWFGTRNDNTYTTVGPVKVEYNGFYCQFYGAEVVEPVPTGDVMIVVVASVLLAGAALALISRKRRFN